MAKLILSTLALAALTIALPQPQDAPSSDCQFPAADIAAPSADAPCGDSPTFVIRINDCGNPFNGQFVTASDDADNSLVIDPNTSWGPIEFTLQQDPNEHITSTGKGTPDESTFTGRAMTSAFHYMADPNALENQYGFMALHPEGDGDGDAIWQQAFTDVSDPDGEGSDGVFFTWAGDSRCTSRFVRFTYTDGDGVTKIGAACQDVLQSVPGPITPAQFEAVYTCQK